MVKTREQRRKALYGIITKNSKKIAANFDRKIKSECSILAKDTVSLYQAGGFKIKHSTVKKQCIRVVKKQMIKMRTG